MKKLNLNLSFEEIGSMKKYMFLRIIKRKTEHEAMKYIEKLKEFPLAPMGVLAPGSAHARPSARPPIDTRPLRSKKTIFEIFKKNI